MQLHRVFIAVNLPEDVKERLLAYKDKWPEIPARWSAKDNLHITLAFLGNTSDEELAEVCQLMQQVGERYTPFSVNINHIAYGPDKRKPRMIWAKIERTNKPTSFPDRLFELHKDIARTLGQRSDKGFSPHLTLARLKAFELQRMELEEIPQIDEEISLSFPVQSIEVMESSLKRSGASYIISQSVPLTQN